jgi:hypothetical protein
MFLTIKSREEISNKLETKVKPDRQTEV